MTAAVLSNQSLIEELSDFDLESISGGRLSADGVANVGNAAMGAAAIAGMVCAEPVAAFLVGFGVGCYIVAYAAS